MRKFFLGDVHGSFLALLQCLERCGFNKETDELITGGDIVDGGSQSFECVSELLTIPNRIDIVGNHDAWWHIFLQNGGAFHPTLKDKEQGDQGAEATLLSYQKNCGGKVGDEIFLYIPEEHKTFFRRQVNKYRDGDKVFVHGGFYSFEDDTRDQLTWDRTMLFDAITLHNAGKQMDEYYTQFDDIFIGHTATTNYRLANGKFIWLDKDDRDKYEPITTPINVFNIWNLDTGAGGCGKLTIMDIDTKEYWQSDLITDLYPK